MLTFSGISRQFEGFGRDVICWRGGLSSTEAYVTLETMTVTFTLRHCGCQLSECPLAHRDNKYSRKKTRNTVWTRFASKSRYWARKQRSSAYREWRAVELLLRESFSLSSPWLQQHTVKILKSDPRCDVMEKLIEIYSFFSRTFYKPLCKQLFKSKVKYR